MESGNGRGKKNRGSPLQWNQMQAYKYYHINFF